MPNLEQPARTISDTQRRQGGWATQKMPIQTFRRLPSPEESHGEAPMSTLEALQPTPPCGILPDCLVTVVSVQWFGSEALELTYKNRPAESPTSCCIATTKRVLTWSSRALEFRRRRPSVPARVRSASHPPGASVRPGARRTRPLVEPLPHQITAVYEAMLPRQPLRFLLADDGRWQDHHGGAAHQGADRARRSAALPRLPGSLAEQWQDELPALSVAL